MAAVANDLITAVSTEKTKFGCLTDLCGGDYDMHAWMVPVDRIDGNTLTV